MSSNLMLLDQIWKRQLALVTYGNAYLTQNLELSHWRKHAILAQHELHFRDLIAHYLFAQHFQTWLETLKKQGVQRLSLHSSSLLNEEQNPNVHVELLPYAHFIVSHHGQQKFAWICGKELAEWENSETEENDATPTDIFWRFELNKKLIKKIESDFLPAQWQQIQEYLEKEIFQQTLLQDFQFNSSPIIPYTGLTDETELDTFPLIPSQVQAELIHFNLQRFDAMKLFLAHKIQQPYHADGSIFSPEQQLDLRTLSQKLEELHGKFIIKAANHYQTAPNMSEITKVFSEEQPATPLQRSETSLNTPKANGTGVIKLIFIAIIICALAYYFGL